MNFDFETNGTNTYLVYKVQPSDVIDTMGLGMLTNNKILGLAPTIFTQLDTTRYIKYNVSSKVSAANFFMGPINKKRLTGVFLGIVNAMLSAEDYMIDTNTILLDMDYIFADVSTCETTLICVPVVREQNKSMDLLEFFKDIVFKAKFDQTENCDYVAKLLNYLNSTPAFSLTEFKGILDEIIMPGMKSGNNVQLQTQSVQIQQPQVQNEMLYEEQQAVYVQPEIKQSEEYSRESVDITKKSQQSDKEKQTYTEVTADVNTSFEMPGDQVQVKSNIKKNKKDRKNKDNNFVVNMPSGNKSAEQKVTGQQPAVTEKKMTMFKLLRNYSKENLALYKAQKEIKKGIQNNTENTEFNVPGQQQETYVQQQEQEQPQYRQQEQYQQSQQNMEVEKQEQQNYYETPSYNASESVCPPTTTLTLSDYGQTSLLSKDMLTPVMPYLIRRRNNERVDISKPVFRIGKERTFVDYFIADNPAISRSHANIFTREKKYYIVDTNSLNHTYIDGIMIPSNQETELHSGNIVKLADEEFEFHV